MRRILLVSIPAICLSFTGCRDSARSYPVDSVDRNAVFALAKKPNPLRLIVEITEDGRLSLNKIETGTVSDVSVLSEKLEAIFDDRQKAEINEREVIIDPQGKVIDENLEKLIESLAEVKASPIRIIKNNS